MEKLLSRITVHPDICHGKPVIRNVMYPVETISDLLSAGMTKANAAFASCHLKNVGKETS